MRRRTFALGFALALPLTAVTAIPATATSAITVDVADGVAVPGSYIVTVREGADPGAVVRSAGATAQYTYTSALNGFAATLDAAQLATLLASGDVIAIEQDQVTTHTATQNTVFTGWDVWGQDRIDQRARPLSNTYTYTSVGAGVHAYIFDTGTRATHLDFGGRVTSVYDAFGGNGSDCNGHGSHVAGTVGGNLTGVAKGTTLHGVRVLDCSGNGTVAGIIAAIDYIRVNHQSPAVANMSLSSGFSSAFNTSVTNLINSGVFVAVAAGNNSQNACNYSPSSVTAALVVAASDRNDRRANFSNHGGCVDLYGPGVDVWSAWHTGDDVVARVSGTSQATPHVTGVAALYKATFGDASQATIESWLVNNATNGVITQNRTGTPNKLLFSNGL